MNQYENKIYSQNGEDGIIQHIFDTIGTTNKVAVEIGVSVGGGIETNTMNLITQGVNAFFIRKDVNTFKPLTPQEAWVKLCWS